MPAFLSTICASAIYCPFLSFEFLCTSMLVLLALRSYFMFKRKHNDSFFTISVLSIVAKRLGSLLRSLKLVGFVEGFSHLAPSDDLDGGWHGFKTRPTQIGLGQVIQPRLICEAIFGYYNFF
ncbi:hypothetical protein AMTRI_Chr09g34630 [Amborella trichopoda]